MAFEVVVSKEVAAIGDGLRRRAGLVFSSTPTVLEKVPPEVEADPHLVVREVGASASSKKRRPRPSPES